MTYRIDPQFIAEQNTRAHQQLQSDYEALAGVLSRRGCDIETLTRQAQAFAVALPSWGVGTGGTRFARFPGHGEPRNVFDKIDDCGTIHQLTRVTPGVSLHFPWDRTTDARALREAATRLGLHFDAVNSNTFQDAAGQAHSYKFGSLTALDPEVRAQAVAHNIDCIELGHALGSKGLTVWIGDGANFPGQSNLRGALERYLESMRAIYAALPSDWLVFIEHKMFEPAFYSTVISDWGSSILAAQTIGERCKCLVDLGHHAPNVNIEQIVARLHRFGKLGGFHFNDSKYGDDDLDSGSINPHQLFLVFNELAEAEANPRDGFNPSYMIDQSHNVTDPIESMLSSAEAITACFAKASLVDRAALHGAQEANDTMMAFQALRRAYNVDVAPILAMARVEAGGALDVLAAYRASGYRARKAQERKAVGLGAGIV